MTLFQLFSSREYVYLKTPQTSHKPPFRARRRHLQPLIALLPIRPDEGGPEPVGLCRIARQNAGKQRQVSYDYR